MHGRLMPAVSLRAALPGWYVRARFGDQPATLDPIEIAMRTRVTEMLGPKRSRDEIANMLQSEFKFAGFHQQPLDGLLAELR